MLRPSRLPYNVKDNMKNISHIPSIRKKSSMKLSDTEAFTIFISLFAASTSPLRFGESCSSPWLLSVSLMSTFGLLIRKWWHKIFPPLLITTIFSVKMSSLVFRKDNGLNQWAQTFSPVGQRGNAWSIHGVFPAGGSNMAPRCSRHHPVIWRGAGSRFAQWSPTGKGAGLSPIGERGVAQLWSRRGRRRRRRRRHGPSL